MIGRQAWLAGGLLAALGAAGCGGPLVPSDTYETPLLSFGAILADLPGTADLARMSVGIVWVDPLATRDDLPQPPSGLRVARPTSDLKFNVDLFSPPPDEAIRRLPDPATGKLGASFAFGEIVVYDDGDGDGTFAVSSRDHGSLMFPPDAYRGSTDRRAVVFVETPAKAGTFGGNVWRTLTEGPGYRLVNIVCNGASAAVTTLHPPDAYANMTVERDPSPEMIVTRLCLSPTRTAVDTMP